LAGLLIALKQKAGFQGDGYSDDQVITGRNRGRDVIRTKIPVVPKDLIRVEQTSAHRRWLLKNDRSCVASLHRVLSVMLIDRYLSGLPNATARLIQVICTSNSQIFQNEFNIAPKNNTLITN
jgi:hypothetical protein